MSYQSEFTGWSSLKIEDLLVAYRKAKADCFFENTFPTAIKFAEYEQDLLVNLSGLLSRPWILQHSEHSKVALNTGQKVINLNLCPRGSEYWVIDGSCHRLS